MKQNCSLYDRQGRRKFIAPSEREALLAESYNAPAHHRSLCFVLVHTGCHLIEALELTADSIDFSGHAIILADESHRTRSVPVPASVVNALDMIHGIARAQERNDGNRSEKLWPVDRTTAWRWILAMMEKAEIYGPQASPRGLRHGFIVEALSAGTPLKTVHHWTGHKDIASTQAYAKALCATKSDET